MKQEKTRVSVLMPCFNEEKAIGACVSNAIRFLNENKIEGEVLVVDNNSTDASAKLAKEAGARVVCERKQGYGAALRAGIRSAEGEYILMLDADGSYDVAEGMPFLEKLGEGYDFVIGNRFAGEIETGAMPWLHRRIGNPLLSALGRKLSHTKIGDFHCGMRAFRKESIGNLQLMTEQMEFASEMIMKAAANACKMTEVPCNLYRDKREGRSHLRPVRDGLRHLCCMWKNRKGRKQ
ncbi:MAG: glycosyltransferase family 2 protein [Lachnospiraceae bacterium]|nr:glycosyltransferase family 2 protein [Lachnospiraceae bacterium]